MANMTECRWCGMTHGIRCPTIRAIEYFEDGTVKCVEFMRPNDYWPITFPNPPQPIYPDPCWSPMPNICVGT